MFGTYRHSFPENSSTLHVTVQSRSRQVRKIVDTVADSLAISGTVVFTQFLFRFAALRSFVFLTLTTDALRLITCGRQTRVLATSLERFCDTDLKRRSLRHVFLADGTRVPSFRSDCGISIHRVRIPFFGVYTDCCALSCVYVFTDSCRIRITSGVDYFGKEVQNKLVYSLDQYFLTTKVFPRISGVTTWDILTSIDRQPTRPPSRSHSSNPYGK